MGPHFIFNALHTERVVFKIKSLEKYIVMIISHSIHSRHTLSVTTIK